MKAPQGTLLAALSFLTILGLWVLSCGPAVAPTATPVAKQLPTPIPAVQLAPSPTPVADKPAPPSAPTVTPPLRPPAAAPASAGEQPKYGGVLKRNLQEGPGRLDLHQSVSYRDAQPLAAIYNLLVKIDTGNETKVLPDLAQSWEVSSDGKVYTFRLAQGVQWHDGQPLTSADVKASFDRIVFPPKGVFSARQAYYAALDKIEAPDAQTVKFVLKAPQPSFVFMLAVPFSVIYPKHLLDKQADLMLSPMGTGPFRFKEHIRGVSFTIEKNPSYFKKGRPYLDGMVGYVIPDPGAAEAALKTKQVDMIAPGHPTLAPSVRAAIKSAFPEIVVKVQPVVVLNSFVPNFEKKPWSDIRVRKALMLTTDQRAAIDVAKLGDAAKGGFMAPGPWSIPLLELEKLPGFRKPTEQDVAQAKKLLGEAGYPTGLKLNLLVRNLPDIVRVSVFARDHLSKLGIDAALQIKEQAAFQEARVAGTWEAMAYPILAVELNEPDIILSRYLSNSPGNYGKYNNPAYDKLYARQSQTLDAAERKKLILDMQQMLIEDPPAVPYFWDIRNELSWPWVKGFRWFNHYVGDWDLENVWLAR